MTRALACCSRGVEQAGGASRNPGSRCRIDVITGVCDSVAGVERAEPGFVQPCSRRAGTKTMATVRTDGSPRIFGTKAAFEDGEMVFGFHAERAQGCGSAVRPALRHG
jgi:hypothetical protein